MDNNPIPHGPKQAAKASLFNRAGRRKLKKVQVTGKSRSYYNRPTGTTEHFRRWKQEAAEARILVQIPTDKWLERDRPKGMAVKVAEVLAEAYPTLADLAGADRADLLGLSGVGSSILDKVAEALRARGVRPVWDERAAA
jgi:hypothetical protein